MFWSRIFALSSLAFSVSGSPIIDSPFLSSKLENGFGKRDVPMCGSATGIRCGMNVCCSAFGYCGTTVGHCAADSCQTAFGSCQIPQPKKCGTGSGTTTGRSAGYYRGAPATGRTCDVVQPSNIDTSKFSHLYYAFANFDSSYNVIPFAAEDVPLYTKFTALKSATLQTWIAVGGGGGGTPWGAMVSSQANRNAFIKSLVAFMSKYGFQGVDLDWEVPLNQADMTGYVSLVKDMRTAFAKTYGISIAVPVDYGDMFYFDAKSMAPYVDSFGFMAYDLKNPDGSVAAHTDILILGTAVQPLWFDGIDPKQVNLGLATYGRGYTLADKSCTTLNCAVTGPSLPGSCIKDTTGVMALFDIKTLITQRGLTPKLNSQSMFKQITFDDQWIGYDDAETIALKKAWGNDLCLGGTMTWAIDLGTF